MITKESIDQVRGVDIVSVIGEFMKLTHSGSNWKGCCPFHGEKTPSFRVSGAKQIFKCFGCGIAGDNIAFIMEHEKLDFYAAVELIAEKHNIRLEYDAGVDKEAFVQKRQTQASIRELTKWAAKIFREQLYDPKNASVMEYLLNQREMTADSISLFQLGFAPAGKRFLTDMLAQEGKIPLAIQAGLVKERIVKERKDGSENDTVFEDVFKNRVMFPIHNEYGELIGFGGRTWDKWTGPGEDKRPKYINSAETALYSKRYVLYGLNIARAGIKEKGFATLVEGYIDVISMHQAGMDNTVAKSGTVLTDEQARLLKRFTEIRPGEAIVLLMPDNDKPNKLGKRPGLDAAMKDIQLLITMGFKVEILLLPEQDGKKMDPDDFARSFYKTQNIDAMYKHNDTGDMITEDQYKLLGEEEQENYTEMTEEEIAAATKEEENEQIEAEDEAAKEYEEKTGEE